MENKEEKTIIRLVFDDGGQITNKEEKIECFHKNGEMSLVEWFRQGNCEYNGKYVAMIEYVKSIN